jgi:hypothetical protein
MTAMASESGRGGGAEAIKVENGEMVKSVWFRFRLKLERNTPGNRGRVDGARIRIYVKPVVRLTQGYGGAG